MRVEQFLEHSASRLGDKIAVMSGDSALSYRQLDSDSSRLAVALRERGIGRHDRVIVFLDNCAEAAISIFAILKAGATFCVVNPTTKADKLAYILGNCRASGVITQARLKTVADKACKDLQSVKLVVTVGSPSFAASSTDAAWTDMLEPARLGQVDSPGIDVDLAMIIYTSGSTGFAKGVMMTHRNIEAAAASITTYLESREDDIVLSVLPLSFDYGLYQLLMSVKVGATLILEKSFTFPQMTLQKLKRERATAFPLVPTMAALIVQMSDLTPGEFPNLRYITNTAAALPPSHIARLQELFTATRIYSMYGLTECKRCTYLSPEWLNIRPGSVGKAIPNTEVYVADDRGEPLGPGQIGELVIRGPHVMQGYWENPQATDRVLRPGRHPWEKVLHSGDLFRADEEGFLYFIGRKDDIIKTRGEKVSPKEIENVLYALPGVAEAAIVGVPDTILGMSIKAIIVPTEDAHLTERDVLRHCASQLEDFMVPKRVEFRDELPKTDTGKIRRSQLQAEVLSTPTAPE